MCTNRALVDSLECYMDDLVDCFEDFVKKSLILISVGVATVVVMLVYMLRVVSDRPGTQSTDSTQDSSGHPIQRCRSDISIPSTASKTSSKRSTLRRDFLPSCEPRVTCRAVNTAPISTVPSFNEQVLRNIGFSNCNKNCEQKSQSCRSNSQSRISIRSLPTCLTKQTLSPGNCVKVFKRTSCCSMCCDDDKLNAL